MSEEMIMEVKDVTSPSIENEYEFNAMNTSNILYNSIFNCGVYDYFNKDEIAAVLQDPITHYDTAIRLSEFVYGKNGVVGNSIDYMKALMTLDRIVISKSKNNVAKTNRELMKSTLSTIDDKGFIRDALFTEMLDGIAFYYFETTDKNGDKKKYLTDYEADSITEINELGVNASIISLPWEYTKIVGKRNGRYVIAFNLSYFDNLSGESLDRKLKKYPKEIVDGYHNRNSNGNWLVLDYNHTMCRKIKSKNSEPWGRSLIISALSDVLYKDYFTDTKRNVLDEVNNKLIYETFPEGKEKGSSALTKVQQEAQHTAVKNAVMNKNQRGGTSFVSLAAGTKLDAVNVSTDIFNNENESNLNNDIATDLGISASLIGAMTTGNYAAGTSNLQMITAQLYTWIEEWKNELVHVINNCIIKDKKNKVDIYYFPTSFVNRNEFFTMMKDLYTSASGSMTFLIASTGVDPDIYYDVLDSELAEGIYDKYLPHQTAWTTNNDSSNDDDGGRPESKDSTNENTLATKSQNGNDTPSPSDN